MLGLGMISGGATSAASTLKLGSGSGNSYSILMDGTNDYLSQPDGDNIFDTLATGSWTLSFYIKFITTTNQTIFWKGTYPSDYLWVYCNSGGDLGITGATGVSTTVINTVFNSNMSADTWHHVAIVSDGSATNRSTICYIDGDVVGTNSESTIASSTNIESQTGATIFTTSQLAGLAYFNQALDHVATWNSVLDEDNIAAIYNDNPVLVANSGNYTGSARLQKWLKMEEGTGTTAVDDAGNGFASMTLVNGAAWSTDKPW
jgi:hypothetical protein